jgi:endonuclease/exonuclease/phosphatase family metal-dependent hydrolase
MSLKRRHFLGLTGAILASTPTQIFPQDQNTSRLRTIAYNVLQMTGYPAAKARQVVRDVHREMPANFAAALRRYSPDIVTISEAPDQIIVRELASSMGMRHAYFPSGENWPGAILTRFEIVEFTNTPMANNQSRPAELFTRHWGAATLKTPDGDLRVHSVHLHPSDASIRAHELKAILESIEWDLQGRMPVIVQGDFNFPPAHEDYETMKDSKLIDAYGKKGQGPAHTFNSDHPNRRIDYIWVSPDLAERLLETRVLFQSPFHRDARNPDAYALSDHLPVMATFGD